MRKKSVLVLLALCAVLCFTATTAIAAPAGHHVTQATSVCDTSHVHFAKTKFVFHLGLAFGVFHRWIYKPFRAGAFKKGASHRVAAFVKAGAAGLFVVHELREACKDANSSSILRPLLTPLNLIVTQFSVLAAKLKGGKATPTDLTSAGGAVTSLGSQSSGAGLAITELTTGFGG